MLVETRTVDPRTLARSLGDRLIASATPTGGWAYYPGHASRIEATAWAMLALAATRPGTSLATSLAPSVTFLRRVQRNDGWLVDTAGPGPNVAANALAHLALRSQPSIADASAADRLPQAAVWHDPVY
jgi:hypothetical protein